MTEASTKFKVGDRFTVVKDEDDYWEPGTEGTVTDVRPERPYPLHTTLGVFRDAEVELITPAQSDPIEPDHYQHNGVNFIEFIEHLPGNRFNAMKYLYRAGVKNPDTLLEDLKKAQWSLNREIERLERDVP